MILWLAKIKNLIFTGVATILGAFVIWFRWSAVRFERKAEEANARAQQEARRAEGAEKAIDVQEKANEAVREVRERQKTDPPVDLTRPW